jgi:hypothetical protein
MEIPKIKYRNSIEVFNTNNLWGQKTLEDMEEFFYAQLNFCKNWIKSPEEKTSFLFNTIGSTLGSCIPKEYFLEILKYVGISKRDILMHLSYLKKIYGKDTPYFVKWLYDIYELKIPDRKNE